jgi:hypothetical protein
MSSRSYSISNPTPYSRTPSTSYMITFNTIGAGTSSVSFGEVDVSCAVPERTFSP